MDKTTWGLLAALGAATQMGAAQAAVSPVEAQRALHAATIAELLDPIPNAAEILKTAQAEAPADGAQVAQLVFHHHHHHHHPFLRRLFHHHHHHHHFRHHHHHHMM